MSGDGLLGPSEIRALAAALNLRPSKRRGQNFVFDPNTVRKIVRLAQLEPGDVALEVGPGLGSLTLGLLPACSHVTAVEIEPALAAQLTATVADRLPGSADRLTVVEADAMHVADSLPGPSPTALVANLPYNVAVPVLLTLLGAIPTIRKGLVMVQAEVAQRLAAEPGSRIYGLPSVKMQWYGTAHRVGSVGRRVFWPEPRVDSGLVRFERHTPPDSESTREEVFAVIDAAFSQRRKALRSALTDWAGGTQEADDILHRAGIAPLVRGEVLVVEDFSRIADARAALRRT